MLLSRLLILFGFIWLAGCSDLQVRSLGASLSSKDIFVEVAEVDGRNGQLYSRKLRTRLDNNSAGASHQLISSLSVSSSSALAVRGATSQLKKMTMSASVNLIDLSTGEQVMSDTITADATLGTVTSYYAQQRSDKHASERLAMLLADRVAARVHLYFLDPDA
ncbi:hypothetical protein N9E91_01790 [Alphaproteobacteria bacterium]|jgi:LPS-assembly lipoprotein|nr:hypothetical protein [Alphaproteobacteria bacterium]